MHSAHFEAQGNALAHIEAIAHDASMRSARKRIASHLLAGPECLNNMVEDLRAYAPVVPSEDVCTEWVAAWVELCELTEKTKLNGTLPAIFQVRLDPPPTLEQVRTAITILKSL